MNHNQSKRRFIKSISVASVAVPFVPLSQVFAGGHLPKLEESNAQASALGYKHDAGAVDHAKYQEGQTCGNCNLFKGEEGDEWGECPIFAGKEVAGEGWCAAYVKRS